MKLTRVDQFDQAIPKSEYVVEDEAVLVELILHHPDFQVVDQMNLGVTIYPRLIPGFPVEVARRKNDGTKHYQIVGYLDQRNAVIPLI